MKKLHMRRLRNHESGKDDDHEETIKVVNFLSHTRWAKAKKQEGGVTWLELFLFYKLHAPPDRYAPLAPKSFLQSDIANFKRKVRKINLHCVQDPDDWHLKTCHGRANRLKQLAISNKHAGVQGMPEITDKEADAIMRSILAMRGGSSETKKGKAALAKGELWLKLKPFIYELN